LGLVWEELANYTEEAEGGKEEASARRFQAWKIIMAYLPAKELLSCRAVCKTF
jgi:hypothetical protein